MAAFDLKTHIINKKGQVVAEHHYIMKCTQGVRTFERPPKSGNWFHEDGSPVEKESLITEVPKVEAKLDGANIKPKVSA